MLQIKLTKMLLMLTEAELLKCLCREPAIMTAALKRGKSEARYQKELMRKGGADHE
jgi:hypothetical protein